MVATCALSLGLIFTVSPAASAAKGDKVPAATLLKRLNVAPERAQDTYDRYEFDYWNFKKGQCDTRETVLASESRVKVKKRANCSVTKGRWKSEYNGKTIRNPRAVHIDHRVDLSEAWRSGAYKWSDNRRRGFANDVKYKHSLVGVTQGINKLKGGKDPADWLPPSGKCQYVARWIAVKSRWGLSVDPEEKAALERRLKACGTKRTLVEKPGKGKAEAEKSAPKKKAKKKPSPKKPSGRANPTSAWNCPSSHPIKGNASSMIYHVPGARFYSRTKPEACFSSESAARAAGYRKAKV